MAGSAGHYVVMSFRRKALNTGAVRYAALFHGGTEGLATTESAVQQPMPCDGTNQIIALKWNVTAAPGSGKKWVFVLREDGVDTGVTAEIADTATEPTSWSGLPFTKTKGALYSISITPTGTPAAANTALSILMHNSQGKFWIAGGVPSGTTTIAGVTRYLMGLGLLAALGSSSTAREFLFPVSGTCRNMYVWKPTAPGSGETATYRPYHDGAAATPSVVISDTATSGSDTSSSFTVAAGARLAVRVVGSAAASGGNTNVSFEFEPDTAGQYVWGGAITGVSVSASEYADVIGGGAANTTTGTETPLVADVELISCYLNSQTAPGSGKSIKVGIRLNTTDDATACATVSDTATTANATFSVNAVEDDLVGAYTAPTGTPTDPSTVRTGYGVYYPPDPSTGSNIPAMACYA